MKVVATLNANLDRTPIGTRSRLADRLNGETVLATTVQRVSRIRSVERVYVFCPTEQQDHCGRLLAETSATVVAHNAGPPPWTALIRTARKWSLNGWRGGIGGATSFDEYTDVRLIDGLLEKCDADAVLCVAPAAVLFDPALGEQLVARRRAIDDEARIAFVQAPPGLGAILLDSRLIRELAEKSLPVGAIFGYKPEAPQKDLIFEPCCCPTSADVRCAAGRLIADTDRAVSRIKSLLEVGATGDADALGRRLIAHEEQGVALRPVEVEVELTTDNPFANTVLRPSGERVPRRGPLPIEGVHRLANELAECDDGLCVLGGFGDPLRHPQLPAVLEALRPRAGAGVYGLAIRTYGVDLSDETMELLIAHGVDVLNVVLDAWTPQTYRLVHGEGDQPRANLECVVESLECLAARKKDRRSVTPLVVPELCKSRDNVDELDAFYDGWMRRLGIVSITGFRHYGGRLDDRGVIRMAPSDRRPCRRLRMRAFVLADGRVTLCDEDFEGTHAVGSIHQAPLAELWTSAPLRQARTAHLFETSALPEICRSCEEWHRP